MCEQGFETAPEKRGLLSPSGIVVDFKRLFPLTLRSRRFLAASRRAVTEKMDSPFTGEGTSTRTFAQSHHQRTMKAGTASKLYPTEIDVHLPASASKSPSAWLERAAYKPEQV